MASLRKFIHGASSACIHAPTGCLKHPFVDPGEGYRGILWDWDAYFCLLGLEPWADEVADAARGCVLNFVEHRREDGSIPYALTSRSSSGGHGRAPDGAPNSAKPLLAQFALMAARYTGEKGWLAGVVDALAAHCRHWEETQFSRHGLFTFRSHRGSGTDDHPAVYGRPFNSSADVFLNSLMVREYRAMAEIEQILVPRGSKRRAAERPGRWSRKADALAAKIVALMWDPIDGAYYNLDVGCGDAGRVNQQVIWPVPLKFRSWTMVMPLWAKIAPKDHAERLVREHVLNPDGLRSPFGVRSLARNEPAYGIAVGSNPSCWRGPIWIVANYLAWCGLRNYGFMREAGRLARDVAGMLRRDLEKNGQLHEYYHPDSGAGLTHPGFLNWNTLIVRMLDDAEAP